jgi:hypothetical protein
MASHGTLDASFTLALPSPRDTVVSVKGCSLLDVVSSLFILNAPSLTGRSHYPDSPTVRESTGLFDRGALRAHRRPGASGALEGVPTVTGAGMPQLAKQGGLRSQAKPPLNRPWRRLVVCRHALRGQQLRFAPGSPCEHCEFGVSCRASPRALVHRANGSAPTGLGSPGVHDELGDCSSRVVHEASMAGLCWALVLAAVAVTER